MRHSARILLLALISVLLAAGPCFAGSNTRITAEDLEFLDEAPPIASFQAVSVDDDGAFAVLSRYQKVPGYESPDWVCALVFRPDGSYRIGLRFQDNGGDYIRLDGDTLYIYQLKEAIVVDLEGRTMRTEYGGYNEGTSKEFQKQLRQSRFSVGGWEYSCKGGINWSELQRTNGSEKQTLLVTEDLPQFIILPYAVSGVLVLSLAEFIVYRIIRRKVKNP